MTTDMMRDTSTYIREEQVLDGLTLDEIKNRKEMHVSKRSAFIGGYRDFRTGRWHEEISDPAQAQKYAIRILAAADAIARFA